jgi:hypothetical protein
MLSCEDQQTLASSDLCGIYGLLKVTSFSKESSLAGDCNHSHNMTFALNEMWRESMKHGPLCNLRS